VLRGGYGVFYAYLEPYGDAEWLVGNPPDAFGVTLTSSPTVPALILAQGPAPGALTLAKASGVTLSSIERHDFVPTPQFALGSAGRNVLRQRGFFNWDFAAHKEFRLHERLHLQFRFEAFAFTNTPRFGEAGTTLGTATFGKITSADTPRNLQFGLKLVW
jgi:hypothetical protein